MSDYIIETNRLTKFFDGKPVVNSVSLKIKKGKIVGFLGRNGAGKSTFIKMLLGFLMPNYGTSKILGCDSRQLTPEIRERIGYMVEGHPIYPKMSIKQLADFSKASFPKWKPEIFNEMMDYFELNEKKKIIDLSRGQRAQVSLALTLAPDPEVLVLDDPTLGIDPVINREFIDAMVQLIQNQKRTIFFSSHAISSIDRIADEIVVLENGVLKAHAELSTFKEKIKKIQMKVDNWRPSEVFIPGLLKQFMSNNLVTLTIANYSEEVIHFLKDKYAATEIEIIDINLEDAFIDFTAGNKSKMILGLK
jgi:ABC-2 type transport system ATP-binding protein